MVIKTFKKIFSMFIISTVFLFTGTTTFLIIERGVKSESSNYKLLTTLVNSQTKIANAEKSDVGTGEPGEECSTVELSNRGVSTEPTAPDIRLVYEVDRGENIGLYADNGAAFRYFISRSSNINQCTNS